MVKLGHFIAKAEVKRLGLHDALIDMLVFEQMHGNDRCFYSVPALAPDAVGHACRLRLMQRTPNGRVRLTPQGRQVAADL